MSKIPAPQPPADQRKKLRIALLIKKIRLNDDKRVFFGYASNISCSGFFISSINPAPVGSRFNVEIPLPEPLNLTICCECETVWRRPYAKGSPLEPGMGLRFIDLEEEIKQTIDSWIALSKPITRQGQSNRGTNEDQTAKLQSSHQGFPKTVQRCLGSFFTNLHI
jgi:hypothetical protein